MLIHATEEEMRFIETELLHLQQTDKNFEVQMIPDDENSKKTSGFKATTLLHLAAKYGNAKATQYLVDNGCNVDISNPSGCTPLMIAIHFDECEVVQMLLDANANIFLSNRFGVSAANLALRKPKILALMILEKLKIICHNDSQVIAKMLLEIDCTLARATLLRDTSIVKYMLDNGRAVDEPDPHFWDSTALQHAVFRVDLNMVKLLLDHGADVNVANKRKETALFYYDTKSEDRSEKLEILKIMLDSGASLTTPELRNQVTPVVHLLRVGKRDTVRLLLKYVSDLSSRLRSGVPLLHILMLNSNPGMIEEWQNKDWDFSILDKEGKNALCLVMFHGNIKSLEFLLRKGVDPNVVDIHRYTALVSLAVFSLKGHIKNQSKCGELLLCYGADAQYEIRKKTNFFDYLVLFLGSFTDFLLAKIILAHLALMEELGQPIKKRITKKINGSRQLKKYFIMCKCRLEKMKRTVICGTLTLFEFLTENEKNVVIHARNPKVVAQLERIMHSQRRSTMYYCNMLRRRIRAVVKRVESKNLVILFLSENGELRNNDYLIEKIVEFIN